MTVVKTVDLSCGYGGVPLVKAGTLEIGAGESRVIVGPNGAGKSTLLRTLCGALAPVTGTVSFEGRSIHSLGHRERARVVAMLMQIQPLDPSYTVEELVRLGRTPYLGRWGHLGKKDRESVESVIELCGLEDLKTRTLGKMSGGERQRARLAMVLAQETPVVLLDEPTSHLDMDHRYMLFEILSRIRLERGCAVIMVSHSLADAERFGDSTIYIKDREAHIFGPGEKDALKTAIVESAHVPDDWIY